MEVLEHYKKFGTGFDRAWYLMLRWPEIYDETTLRIGSLGRRTKGRGMFWELRSTDTKLLTLNFQTHKLFQSVSI